MENKIKIPEHLNQDSQQTDQQVDPIKYNKYQMLKSLPETSLSEIEKIQINQYESNYNPKETIEAVKNYTRRMYSQNNNSSFKTTPLRLWNVFKHNFFIETKKHFEETEFTLKNIQPLIYYFSRDERFFTCENVSQISKPSFNKGILLIGNVGNGKTSVMRTFERIFRTTKGVSFKGFSANEIVTLLEKCSDNISKAELMKKINSGSRYFDDVKTEREVSNYGKVNIFKDIIEFRYDKRISNVNGEEILNKTHITCNFKEGFEGDVNAAVSEFGEKYGGRVYDRMFDMFNIIEFKGPSFRK